MMLNLLQMHILLGMMWKMWCAPRGFILIHEQKIWQEAQTYCRTKHLDLATVQSHEDRSLIGEVMVVNSSAWIGLCGGQTTWHWSIHSEPIGFQAWEAWEPDTTGEGCAFITAKGNWGDDTCFTQKFFLCFNENLNKHHLIRIKLNWHDARQHCRTYHTDLVKITDPYMNLYLAGLVFGSFQWDAWIGLSKNTWLWSDRTVVSLASMRWIDTQPYGSESCGFVRADGAIGGDVCSVPRPFLCTQIRKQQTLRLAVKADANVTDVTAMTAVEETINQILSEKAMDAESNVTLRVYSETVLPDVTEDDVTAEPCEE